MAETEAKKEPVDGYGNTHPEHATVQDESLGLRINDVAVFQALSLGHKGGFMAVGVELLPLPILGELRRIESLQTVLLQGVHDNSLSHLEAMVEVVKILIGFGLFGDLIRRHRAKSPVKVVN